MAARDIEHLREELEPLRGHGPAPRNGRHTKIPYTVALGMGLAAAAAYTLTSGGKSEQVLAHAQVDGSEEKFGNLLANIIGKMLGASWGTGPLTLESDMGKFIVRGKLPKAALGKGWKGTPESLGESAAALFDHIAKTTAIKKELNPRELQAYKYRFVEAMVSLGGRGSYVFQDYVARAQKHIEGTKPVMSESLAAVTNNRQNSFQVKMQPWLLDESVSSFESRLIKVPFAPPLDATKVVTGSLPNPFGYKLAKLPAEFKSATFWPKCADIIQNPHNQGRCGSCWVFGAAGALDSRLCIATDGAFSGPNAALSRGMAASCASNRDGCQGGWPHLVYDFIARAGGLPSTNCVPYFGGTDYASHWTDAMGAPACPTACDARYPRQFLSQDLFRPLGIEDYQLVDKPDETGIANLKEAIMTEGPVSYALYANRAFMGYSGGVFDQDCGHQANHAVQAIGFGKMHGKEYIQSLNSWGTDWGLKGTFNVAPCVVWHFVIPGSIVVDHQGSGLPLPILDWRSKAASPATRAPVAAAPPAKQAPAAAAAEHPAPAPKAPPTKHRPAAAVVEHPAPAPVVPPTRPAAAVADHPAPSPAAPPTTQAPAAAAAEHPVPAPAEPPAKRAPAAAAVKDPAAAAEHQAPAPAAPPTTQALAAAEHMNLFSGALATETYNMLMTGQLPGYTSGTPTGYMHPAPAPAAPPTKQAPAAAAVEHPASAPAAPPTVQAPAAEAAPAHPWPWRR